MRRPGKALQKLPVSGRMEDVMPNTLLEIQNLTVNVEDKEILHGINLKMNRKGKPMCSWAPTEQENPRLGYALMGNPNYEVKQGPDPV